MYIVVAQYIFPPTWDC